MDLGAITEFVWMILAVCHGLTLGEPWSDNRARLARLRETRNTLKERQKGPSDSPEGHPWCPIPGTPSKPRRKRLRRFRS